MLFRESKACCSALHTLNANELSKTGDNTDLLGHHHLDKFLIIDLPISINISFTDHLINLLIGQLFSKVCHHVPQLRSTNESIAITIKHLEGLNQLFFGVCILHLPGHQGKELWEIDGTISICIHFIDHVLELSLGGILSQRAHDCSQLLGSDSAITVLIEEREGLLELRNLLLSQLICHWILLSRVREWSRENRFLLISGSP